ncbi:MAG: DegT/DnrJ/EryC1/StrS family aminotransferase [Thermoguttaceae bacterium]|nr:DegT/DnrJ/EryC1/StrS family aminotransferase [Thermoguttaceae bacterium]
MSEHYPMSRRQFVAGASGALLAGAGAAAAEKKAGGQTSGLAIEGGPKAVTKTPSGQPRWGEPELKQLEAMLRQGSLFYWEGPQTKLLIERFQQVCPRKYVQTCSSGTAALHIAVAAAGIGPGDEVITSPVTDIGTVIGVLYQQAVPVFADLGAGTYNLDVADVERRITPKTKAIIAVHLTGNPCDLDALKALADRHKLILIEDCAQAWGAKYRGRPIGTVGHFACFSLQNSKHVTCGDGGVVASNDDRFGPLLQKFGDKGGDRRKWGGFDAFATNYRMSEPQAAVAAAQLTRLEAIAAKRARLGNLLTEKIADLPGIIPHQVHPDDRAVYWFYMFRMKPEAFRCNRSQFVKAVLAEGAPITGGYIKVPLYGEPVFQKHAFFAGRWPVKEMGLTTMDFSKHKCPEAEAILATGMRVPIYEYMTEEYILSVAEAIRKVARHYAA